MIGEETGGEESFSALYQSYGVGVMGLELTGQRQLLESSPDNWTEQSFLNNGKVSYITVYLKGFLRYDSFSCGEL
jgi:hypothetical protein